MAFFRPFMLYAFIAIQALAIPLYATFAQAQDTPLFEGQETSEEYSFRISVERHLEDKLNRVLREVTGIEHLVAIVKAEVQSLERPAEDPRVDKESLNVLFLPGVPARTGETFFAEGASRPPVVVRRLQVKVLVDRDVSSGLTRMAHNVAIELVGYNPDRGDSLVVEEFQFMSEGGGIGKMLASPSFYLAIITLPAIAFLVAATLFFLNPSGKIGEALNKGQEGIADLSTQTGAQQGAEMQALPALPVEQATVPSPATETQRGERHFSFLDEHTPEDIIYALGKMREEDLHVVLNFMSPALAAEVMDKLPEEQRSEALTGLLTRTDLDPEKVMEMQERLINLMEFSSGGDHRLSAILEHSDEKNRDMLIDIIEREDPEAARRISRMTRTFESVMRAATSEGIDALSRRLAPSLFARVLASSPGDVQNKVLESLARGAAELLREELKFARPLGGARLRDEKRRIIGQYNALVEAGLIEESRTEAE